MGAVYVVVMCVYVRVYVCVGMCVSVCVGVWVCVYVRVGVWVCGCVARTIGVLHVPDLEAGLTEEGSLLVAQDTSDGHTIQWTSPHTAVHLGARPEHPTHTSTVTHKHRQETTSNPYNHSALSHRVQ